MMKLLILAAIVSSSSAFAARQIKCEAYNAKFAEKGEIQPINDIVGFKATIDDQRGIDASVLRRTDEISNDWYKFEASIQSGSAEEFCGKETKEFTLDGGVTMYVVCIAKKNPSAGARSEWSVRRYVTVQNDHSCLPGEDQNCTTQTKISQERPLICTDTADSVVNYQRTSDDPCNPRE